MTKPITKTNNTMKKLITKAGQLSFFLIISVPLACTLYITASVISEIKRLITFIKY